MDETGKDNAGFSLLTTENPLTIDHDDQEDAEAEEEQRRRQQELQNMMAYAFDDIGDEENSTINSSFDASSAHALTSGHAGYEESSRQNSDIHLEEQYRDAQFNSSTQMQVLYQVQDREIKRLHAELNTFQEEKEKELTALKRKILMMENEHNGTNISLKQCQDLLVEKKRDIDEHLREINNLKDDIDNLTIAKRKSDEEAQLWKNKYSELEQKMNLIDQGLYVPVSERQIRNKYEQEISDLQNGLEQAQKNLEKAIKAKSIVENEIKEIKQTHELAAIEKEEQIHNLHGQLENSKFQCHNLTDRIDSLEKEYQSLTTMLNNTTKEQETVQYTGPLKTLQQELKRSLDDQKNKRDELVLLEKKLDEQKNIEIELRKNIHDFEDKFAEMLNINNTLQKDKELMAEKNEELTKNIDQLTTNLKETFKSKLEQLEKECRKVKAENVELVQKMDEVQRYSEKIMKDQQTSMEDRRTSYDFDKLNSEIVMLKLQNEQLYKQLEETNKLKKEIELQSLKKIQDLQIEMKPVISDKKLHIMEEQYQSLKKQNEQLQNEFKDAVSNSELYKQKFEQYEKLCLELEQTCAEQKSQIFECHSKISELEGKHLLKEKRDDLLEDLQQKALMFEQYIKHKTDISTHNKSVNTEEEEISKILKAQQEKFIEISNENKTLKEKIVFDRAALNELTDVWNKEMNRLNILVKDLKKEIDSKNITLEKHQQAVNEEMSQMSLLINKLTEALRHKDKYVQEFHDKEINLKKQQEEIKKKIKTDYQQKESRLLAQFEQNMDQMKKKFISEEQQTQSKIENMQKKCASGLEEINERIKSQRKYNSEKYLLETKIIEAYYDLLIQQAKLRNK